MAVAPEDRRLGSMESRGLEPGFFQNRRSRRRKVTGGTGQAVAARRKPPPPLARAPRLLFVSWVAPSDRGKERVERPALRRVRGSLAERGTSFKVRTSAFHVHRIEGIARCASFAAAAAPMHSPPTSRERGATPGLAGRAGHRGVQADRSASGAPRGNSPCLRGR